MTTTPTFDLCYYSEQRANCQPWNWYSLDDFVEIGFTPERAEEWFDADVTPEHALAFENQGMSPVDAWNWRLVPDVVEDFRSRGFTKWEAWEWTEHEIFADEAMFWRHAGFAPADAVDLRAASTNVAQAVFWSLTGLAPQDALDHAAHGADPVDFLRPPTLEG